LLPLVTAKKRIHQGERKGALRYQETIIGFVPGAGKKVQPNNLREKIYHPHSRTAACYGKYEPLIPAHRVH
jgi:hypothetical protein